MLRELLEEGKTAGLTFEEAWARATLRVPMGADWRNPVPGRHGVESVAAFARRHFEAAYRGDEAGRYCQGELCTEVLPPGRRWCQKHHPDFEDAPRMATAA